MLERAARFSLARRGVESKMIATSLGRSHVFSARGTGKFPPIVFLHGFGSAAAPFAPVFLRMLDATREVFAPELPGHGLSDMPTAELTTTALKKVTEEILDALVPEPFVLVGNSMGGALSTMYAIDHPDRVSALVLLSPAAARVPEEDLAEMKRAFDLKSSADVKKFASRVYHRVPWFLPAIANEVRKELTKPELLALLEQVRVEDAPSPEELARLTMPVLFAWGKSERLLPKSALEYFRANLPPHARVIEPANWGHCAHVDDPKGLARTIRWFLDDVLATASAPTP
jgi:pimeloyl-ACP methyl ester carboxylesterase